MGEKKGVVTRMDKRGHQKRSQPSFYRTSCLVGCMCMMKWSLLMGNDNVLCIYTT